MNNNKEGEKEPIINVNGQEYVGSQVCRDCHKAIYDSFKNTVHHLTSGIASKNYIKGSFAENQNTFVLNASTKVVMEDRGDSLFQVAYLNGKEVRAQRFDVVMGSGKKGQSYLYWKSRELYQLPVSYFADVHSWTNSPGFSNKEILFDRKIGLRCLECHTTFTKGIPEYDFVISSQVIYGVDCERCHGPAAKHVAFQEQNPNEKQAKFIINPASLSRQQKLDICALCHSGVMNGIEPAFSFLPGDTLSKYFNKNSASIDSFNLDVHANQYGLLTASKCFRISGTMNCSTCHNLHTKENGDLIAYGQKCVACHTESNHNFCTIQHESTFSMISNCVNCHMPVRTSKNLTMYVAGKTAPSPASVRSHLIAIYADEAKKWIKK